MKTKEQVRISIYKRYYFAKILLISLIGSVTVFLLSNFIITFYVPNKNTFDDYVWMALGGIIFGLSYSCLRAATVDIKDKIKYIWDEIKTQKTEIKGIRKSLKLDSSGNYTQESLKNLMKINKIKEKILKLKIELKMMGE